MASIDLRQGDTLNIVWSSVQDTPLGVKEVESSFAFTYDDLLTRLRTKRKIGKSRRSGTNGARFSRVVALACTALKKGKWSTGAEISRTKVFSKLLARFKELGPLEYANITENAKKSLSELYDSEDLLKKNQKADLKGVVEVLGLIKN